MKKIAFILLAVILLGCSKSKDENIAPTEINKNKTTLTPPSWLIGSWYYSYANGGQIGTIITESDAIFDNGSQKIYFKDFALGYTYDGFTIKETLKTDLTYEFIIYKNDNEYIVSRWEKLSDTKVKYFQKLLATSYELELEKK